MYLKALEMQGFKSFPDKTVLQFGNGITGVVGPNGSGKSNISDAVRWVLGEQSTKSLRGARMEDVIFSGTNERRPQGFAEVTLRLDNSDGALNSSEKEVAVTRKYFRSGESNYLINGQTVRLKDVHELFMDTGLGRDGYSMVGQGKIEEMVSAKSENRRDMLEEAAGISHYRYRRAEAIKRLTQSEENLIRLRDITAELKARVGPLEKQSQKAQQFLVYAEERKELEIGLWLNQLERSSGQIRELNGKLSVVKNQYEFAENMLGNLSAQIDAAAEQTRHINEETETLQAENLRAEEQASVLDSQAAVAKTGIAHNDETAGRIVKELAKFTRDENDIDNEIKENEAEIRSLQTAAEELNTRLAEVSEELNGLKSQDEAYSDEYNAKNTELAALSLELSRVDVMISANLSSANEIEKRLQSIESTLDEKNKSLKNTELTKAENEKSLQKAKEHLTQLKNVYEGFSLKIKNTEAKTEKKKQEYENEKIKLLSQQSRLKFLEDTEKNMEGYQGSVKAVMREKARGTLKGIHGTLIQLIEVEDTYSLAIETALGNAVQDIVTDNENDAKQAIRFLKDCAGGRATFLPLSAIKGRVLEEKGLEQFDGYVALAYELVSHAPVYTEIIRSLLGRIAVCEDLDTAVAMAKKTAYRFKIVTLDGQVINAGGSMTGGSKISNSGFLSRRNEMETLKTAINRTEAAIDEKLSAKKNAEEALAKEKAEYEGYGAGIIEATQICAAKENALSLTKQSLSQLSHTIDELEDEKEKGQKRKAYYEESKALGEAEKENLTLLKQEKEAELSALTGGHDSLLSERERINGEMTQINLSLVASVKERQAKEDIIESLKHRKTDLGQQKAALKQENRELAEKNRELQKEVNQLTEAAAALRRQNKENIERTEALKKEREKLEQDTADAREQEKIKNQERENLSAELVRLEERSANIEKEQEDIQKKLYEEYGLTRRGAAEIAQPIESVTAAGKRLSELKGLIKALGSVNVAAIDEYKEVSERYAFLSGQVNDVEKAKKELLGMIDELTDEMSAQFRERFNAINDCFKDIFQKLFGGGTAGLYLEDENNLLECGIDIKAQPPGKKVTNLSLLSGGEKGLTAIALLFAILKIRPAPFCIFDEVEAALDDVNVLRYAQYVRMMTENTQFILITHRRGTMEEADILYGVTMQEKGVSKLLELKTAEMVAELKLDE